MEHQQVISLERGMLGMTLRQHLTYCQKIYKKYLFAPSWPNQLKKVYSVPCKKKKPDELICAHITQEDLEKEEKDLILINHHLGLLLQIYLLLLLSN
jgi:hypothetical protein